MPKDARVCISVDVDAVAGWLGSYGGQDSSNDVSRGYYAGTVGVDRLLKLFGKHDITTTWFVPGHSLETFPEHMARVRDAGHEFGLHGYSHENPRAMTLAQQTAVLDRSYRLLQAFTGKAPRGIVAPWWEASREGTELMLRYGVEYDHSFSHHDCEEYYLRTGDKWTPIDYSQPAESWMHPLERGQDTGIVEIPCSWYLDDLPPMMFIKASANSHGWVNPRDVEELWMEHWDYFYENQDSFVFPLTIHPDVSGHPHALRMLDRVIQRIKTYEGVRWMTMEQIADEFKAGNTPPTGALLPASKGAVLSDPDLKLAVQT